ncbi:MAG: folate-binding protein YgfZ [Gammaproteobacteria bacterium]|nr:folate-binding protein YgfZ [Gammaproteobacteria bacterium]
MSEQSLSILPEFSVIKLSGQDAYSFLQGQVTCDVNKLKEQAFLPGCHCNAKGKMWSTFIALPQNDDILLLLTKESAEVSLAELNKYGVFAKVDITDDSDNWSVYGAASKELNTLASADYIIELTTEHVLALSSEAISDASQDNNSWWQREILSGRAHLFATTAGEYVPQMLNLQALDYISFNKGCYMGQEMVARMRYLGKNKRALYLAQTDQDLDITVGTDVALEINGNKRNIGKVIQSRAAKGKTVLQLVLPKDTELSEKIYLDAEQDIELSLLELPYALD